MRPLYERISGILETQEGERLPHGEFYGVDEPFVDGAYKSEEEDADEAESESYFSYASAGECTNFGFIVRNPHCFYYTEIVVE